MVKKTAAPATDCAVRGRAGRQPLCQPKTTFDVPRRSCLSKFYPHSPISPAMLWRVRNSRGRPKNAPAAFIASVVVLTIVAFIILIAHKARAQADVGGALTDHSHPGLGRPNSLRLPKPPIDPSGNIVHRNIEIVDTPTLIPGPRIDASLLLPASMKRRPILIDIDVMQVFIPWEFRVAGAFER